MGLVSSLVGGGGRRQLTCVGFMLVIISPDFALTHSLLMKRPVGCVYLRPLGAVSSTARSDMLGLEVVDSLLAGTWLVNVECSDGCMRRVGQMRRHLNIYTRDKGIEEQKE